MDKLGKVLPLVLRRRGLQRSLAERQVKVVFAELIGPSLADCCESVELQGAILNVVTGNPAFAHQLRLDAETILARLNERLLGRRVRTLRVRTGRGPGRAPAR